MFRLQYSFSKQVYFFSLVLFLLPNLAFSQFATTVQLPTFGVSVDADGVLKLQSYTDPTGQLRLQKLNAAKASLPQDILAASNLRKVSLTRLELAIQEQIKAAKPLDESMLLLAGLQRIRYVFCYPETNEIIIAGPAEGWMPNLSGQMVGVTTGRPVLHLNHLMTALRAYPPNAKTKPMIGCTIDPSQAGLQKLQAFQRTIPKTIRDNQRQQVAAYTEKGIKESLGMSQIRVFGVPAESDFAQILIEADYRMKVIGIGLEPTGAKFKSFFDLLTSRSGSMGTLQRWWFVPNYKAIKQSEDQLAMELVGQGVQLLSEDKMIQSSGQLGPGLKANPASDLFTKGFTSQYEKVAELKPVYAQMRNLIDMTMIAAYMQKQNFYKQANWDLGILADEDLLPIKTSQTPTHVPAVVRVVWKGSRMVAPAGGGVQIHADRALTPENLISDTDGKLNSAKKEVALPAKQIWWWD